MVLHTGNPLEATIINHRAYAGFLLTLALLLTACGGGTPPGGSSPSPATPPPSAAAPAADPAQAEEAPAVVVDPAPAPEPGTPGVPVRPERTELTVHAEQVEVTLPFVLVHPPGLGFSTYVFEEFEVEFVDEPAPGIRVSDPHPDRSTFVEVTAFPDGTAEEAALAALHETAADDDAWVQPGVPVRPWAVESVTVDHGDEVDVYFLLEHGGRYLLMRQHFAWVGAEGLAPVLEGFLNAWLWDDGRYLAPR